jgi:filamentous hemagglutinin
MMRVSLPTRDSELRHIFRMARGHVKDTTENRTLLLDVANDESARMQSDQYGTEWATKLLPDNRQVWVQIRGTKIVDAGINPTPRRFNQLTGLKKS